MNKTLNSESVSIEIPIQTIMNAIHSFSQDNQLNQLQLVILTKEQYDESQNREKSVQMNMLELQEEMQRDRSWIIKHLFQDEYFRRKIAKEIVERSNNTIRIEKNRNQSMKPRKRGRA